MTDILFVDRLEQTDSVLSEVMYERVRQISKGYDAAHDDSSETGGQARAAAYYATAAYFQRKWYENNCIDLTPDELADIEWQAREDSVGYPWYIGTRKVSATARKNLIKAAALIVAEIERIDREERAQ